jgi:hypothetical protein
MRPQLVMLVVSDGTPAKPIRRDSAEVRETELCVDGSFTLLPCLLLVCALARLPAWHVICQSRRPGLTSQPNLSPHLTPPTHWHALGRRSPVLRGRVIVDRPCIGYSVPCASCKVATQSGFPSHVCLWSAHRRNDVGVAHVIPQPLFRAAHEDKAVDAPQRLHCLGRPWLRADPSCIPSLAARFWG